MRVTSVVNVGAYLQTGIPAFTGNLGTLAGVYRTPAMHVEVTAVFTHTNPMRPYRGNGRPEAGVSSSSAWSTLRRISSASIRPSSGGAIYIPPDAMPYKTGLTFTYDCGAFEQSMDMALGLADVAGFEARRAEARKRGKLRGIGLSNTIERAGAAGFEGAEIRFDRSGDATILSGSITQGQGHETIYKQLVCDRLGLDPDRCSTSRATPTRCSSARAPAARARRPSAARRSTWRPRRSPPRRGRSPPTCSRPTPTT